MLGIARDSRQLHVAAGSVPLCADGVALGRVALRSDLVWRSDQKEPRERAAIAAAAIRGGRFALGGTDVLEAELREALVRLLTTPPAGG